MSSLLKGIDNLDIDHMHMTVEADAPARHTHSHLHHITDRSSFYLTSHQQHNSSRIHLQQRQTMSASSAPPANPNLNNSSNNNSNSDTGKIKPKTMQQYKEVDAALELDQKVIEEQIKAGESNVTYDLARTAFDLLDQGRAQDALQLYEMTLEKMTKTKGEDHPDTLTMMNNTGMALGDLNRHEESLRKRWRSG
jgi:hypothetical protein